MEKSKKTIISDADIAANQVLLINHPNGRPNVMPLSEAIEMAQEQNLSVIQIAMGDAYPVCKILDKGKYIYEQSIAQKKKLRQNKKSVVKEIRISPNTAENDLRIKAKQITQFLAQGYHVKIVMRLSGREVSHRRIHLAKMESFLARFHDIANTQGKISVQNKLLVQIIQPKPKG